jgi:nicotinamidase-related amidase
MAAPLYARYVPPKSLSKSDKPSTEPISTASKTSKPPGISSIKLERQESKIPKKRKVKELVETTTEVVEEARSKRHETVFAKFNKSAAISQRLKKQAQNSKLNDESHQESKESSPDLHGNILDGCNFLLF